jgi:hypothetical protein
MPVMTSNKKTYAYSLDEVRKLIASDIDVPGEFVTVEYVIREVGGDPMDRYPGTNEVIEVKVTVAFNVAGGG